MSANITPAPEVEKIARNLIPIHHPHLHGSRIDFHFRAKGKTEGDHRTWGTARIVRGAAALLATPGAQSSVGLDFFVIEIAKDVWDEIPPAQREALVDHELSHCGLKTDKQGNVNLTMLRHEVEEFSGVLRRHGMWKSDIARFLASTGPRQLEMFATTIDGMPDLSVYDPSTHAAVLTAPNQPIP